jgi:nucleotide sugar dehydrogenase
MKKIAIIGSEGYVGSAFKRMVQDKYEVVLFDPALGEESATKEECNQADLGVICVPTLMDKSKEFPFPCDTSIVEDCVSWLETPVILIKSTIAPGTTDRLKEKYKKRICMSPEYAGESTYFLPPGYDYFDNMKKTPWNVIGGADKDVNYIFDLLIPILGPKKEYHICTAKEAEVIKYMENTYFGVKITFAQEMYNICKVMDVNWYRVWTGWALDNRVDKMHTAVFPEGRGFAGKCLPKDLNALVRASIDAGYEPKMLKSMLESNREIRKENGKEIDY